MDDLCNEIITTDEAGFPTTYWTYRVIEFTDIPTGEVHRAIHEVYFDNGKPVSYAENAAKVLWVIGEDDEGAPLRTLDRMRAALDKSVLRESDFGI